MKKLTTQATITSFANRESENSIIQSAIAFINHNSKLSLSCEQVSDIQTALSEAINNVVTFAYPNKQGKVSVYIYIYDDKLMKLIVRDSGCGIKDIAKARNPLYSTRKELSGMGFTVMESFCDKLTVTSKIEKGTVVTMDFYL